MGADGGVPDATTGCCTNGKCPSSCDSSSISSSVVSGVTTYTCACSLCGEEGGATPTQAPTYTCDGGLTLDAASGCCTGTVKIGSVEGTTTRCPSSCTKKQILTGADGQQQCMCSGC